VTEGERCLGRYQDSGRGIRIACPVLAGERRYPELMRRGEPEWLLGVAKAIPYL
jgi:hypothetical protein